MGQDKKMSSDMRRRPNLLASATILVALVYGGTLAWLVTTDGRLAGEPVVRLALPPEAEGEPQAEKLLRAGTGDETPAPAGPPAGERPDTANAEAGSLPPPSGVTASDEPTPDEQTLLDAARRVDGGIAADGVKILGAENVSPAPGEADSGPSDKAAPIALRPVPDPALVARSNQGPLPVIARDGRKPWKVYARPLPENLPAGPRIAIVVSGMGISESATAHAIETLPPEITLSFAPYGANLQNWIGKARAAGHEVLLELPMEPFGYPQNDPGPYTLLTSLQTPDNISRLEWLLSRFAGYAGVMNYQGARFTTSVTSLSPVLTALNTRGLMYVDNGASARSLAPKIAGEIGMPLALGNAIIDPVQNPEVIGRSLVSLEETAKQSGLAVGVASAFPVTVDEVTRWAGALREKGFVLVPVTAAVNSR